MHVRIRIKDTFTLISTNSMQLRTITNLVCVAIQQRRSADREETFRGQGRDVPRKGKRRSAERQETFRGKARDGNAEVSCAEFVGFVKFLVICTVPT